MAAVCDRAPLPVGRPLLPPGPLSALLGDTSSPGPPPASPVSFSKALAEALLPAARRWPPGLSACPPGAPWRVCSGHDLTPTAGHVTWLDLESRFLTPCSQRVPVRLKTDSASCLRYAWQTVKCWTKLRAVTLTMIGSLPRSIPDRSVFPSAPPGEAKFPPPASPAYSTNCPHFSVCPRHSPT